MEALGMARLGWIATGSRVWSNKLAIWSVLCELEPAFMVHGDCLKGVDAFVEEWCEENGVPSVKVPARWKDIDGIFRKEAGPLRNRFMLELFPGLPVMAFPEGIAKGTKDCISAAVQRGHRVRVYNAQGKFKEC